MKSVKQNQYTEVILVSLQYCQNLIQYNTDYLNTISVKYNEYLSKITTTDSDEYKTALNVFYDDLKEKRLILTSLTDSLFRRANDLSLENAEYIEVTQTFSNSNYRILLYSYFNIEMADATLTNTDINLYLQKTKTDFCNILDSVIMAVQGTNENDYQLLLLWQLQQTSIVFTQTCDSLESQISQSQTFISQSSESSQKSYYNEMVSQIDNVLSIYASFLIKCHQYSFNTKTVTIYMTEKEIINCQTSITTKI